MNERARAILSEALRLSLEDRAMVAAELLRSVVDAESAISHKEVARSWAPELARRANRAVSGQSVGRDADEMLALIESRLRR